MKKNKQTIHLVICMLLAICGVVVAAPPTVVQTVTHNGETITMRLKRHDLRGTNFELKTQNAAGGYDAVTTVDERSYIGTVDEYPSATSCGIVQDDGTFRGAVYFDRGATWFTSGTGVTGTRADGYADFTGYQLSSAPTVNPGLAGNTMYGYELGVDADYNYFSTAGSVAKAFEQIEFSVCVVRAIYMRDVLLRPYLGRVIVRSTLAEDPYTGSTQGDYLGRVRNEWNDNQQDTDPDLVAGVSPSKIGGGLAWVGVVGTSSGYSVSQSGNTGAFDVVFRHEMGHNWNLPHYVGGSPEGAGLMGGNQPGRFSSTEVKRVLDHRNARISVLEAEGTFTDVELTPYASLDLVTFVQGVNASVTINPIANDHDANGQVISLTGFESASAKGGTVVQQGANLVYTAPGSYLGLDYFEYTISDSVGKTSTGVVLVDVQPGDRLRLYLPLDETSGTVADDKSAFGSDGTLAGTDLATASVGGKFGNAVQFDGVDDHVSTSGVKVSSNTVTLSAWIKPGATQTAFTGIIFDRSSGGSGVNFGTNGELRYHWNNGQYNWNSGLVPATDAWTFVALVIEPNRATIYMNDGSGFQSSVNTATHAIGNLRSIQVGRDPAGGTRSFEGAIDEARVYDQALSAAELQTVYDGGAAEAPTPFDSATDVGPIDLKWASSGAAVSYDVYLGSDLNAVQSATPGSAEFRGSVTEATFVNPQAQVSATSYWRVDVVTTSGTIKGSVWSFTRNGLENIVIVNGSFEAGAGGGGVPLSWMQTSAGSLGVGAGGSDGSKFLFIGPGAALTQDTTHVLVSEETLSLSYASSRTYPRNIQLLAKNSGGNYQLIGETTETIGSSGWSTIEFDQIVGSQYAGQVLAIRVSSGNWNEFDDFRVTSLQPLNRAPVLGGASFAIAENEAAGSEVGLVTGSDPDSGDTLSYAITGGNSAGAFLIDATTGMITTTQELDYESVSSYVLTVEVSDAGGLSDTANIMISVTDVAFEDHDNDGMDDAWEIQYFGSVTAKDGTADTDADGIIDADEYLVGTNPTSNDTDADGFGDELEIAAGTDPSDTQSVPNSSYAGMIGWWGLDEALGASVASDKAGDSNDGAVVGATFNGSEADFDGVDDAVTTGVSLLNGCDEFSMSGWYRSSLTTGNRVGLWGQNDSIEFGINGTSLSLWTLNGGSVSVPLPSPNVWHHVLCVGDGASLKIYVDGLLAGTGGSATSNYGSSADGFNIGGAGIWDSTGNHFDGEIMDVRIYRRAVGIQEFDAAP